MVQSTPYAVLAPDGSPNGKEPDIEPAILKRIYYYMALTRFFDARAIALQRQGRLGTHGPNAGQEACAAASAAALGPDDWIVPTYRELAAMMYHGVTPTDVLARLKNLTVRHSGSAPNVVPINVVIGTTVPHAAGMAMGFRILGEKRVVLGYFGDGATSKGDFHEGANFAGVFKAPVILFCQNNQWAISLPRSKQTAAPTIAAKAVGYGMPGLLVDGQDAVAVYEVTRQARERALAGEGPTLIEAVTYRFGAHTTADDPRRYRSATEEEEIRKKDPIPRLRRYLEAKGLWSQAEEDQMQKHIEDEFARALEESESMKADPLFQFDMPYAGPPQQVREQKRRFLEGG